MTISDRALRLMEDGLGDRALARELGLTRHAARNLIHERERSIVAPSGNALIEPDPHTPDEYAARITACWRKSAEAFIEAGRWLIRAKEELEHGQFGKMIKESLPFKASTAQRLMIVADDEWIANPAHVQHLPPHWGTLYEITKLAEPRRNELLAAGTICPDMERRAIATVVKQQRRANTERVLGGIQCALPDIKAGLILEDFEWHHQTWSAAGMDRHASNHYETAADAITPEEIVARTADRFDRAAPDCVLFQWVPNPHLWIGMRVMALRGFDYKSNYVWGKDKAGTGRWNREKHELLLIGVRGNIPCPAPGTQWDSLIPAPRGAHSEKPDVFYEMIEQYFPTLPKLELNARKVRPGWIGWGNQYPAQTGSEAA